MKEDKYIIQIIHHEINNTASKVPAFKKDFLLRIIERATYICYKRSFFKEYPRGLSELAIPFLYALLYELGDINKCPEDVETLEKIEADLYGLMFYLLQKSNPFFENPLQFVEFFKSIILKIDAPLHDHLVSKNISFSTIGHKLLLYLHSQLIQKVPLIALLWDKYLISNSFGKFHAIVSAFFVASFSEKIIDITDEMEIIKFIEELNLSSWNYREIRSLLSEICTIAEAEGLYNPNQTTEFPDLKILDVVSLYKKKEETDHEDLLSNI